MKGDPALVGGVTVLVQINALPGAQGQATGAKGDAEIHSSQGRADVGGHVIVAFGRVTEEGVTIGGEAREEAFEVILNRRIRVFLDEQGGGGVLKVKGGQTGLEMSRREEGLDLIGDFVEGPTLCGNLEFAKVLFQHGRNRVMGNREVRKREGCCGMERWSRIEIRMLRNAQIYSYDLNSS
jgi:hypothetical protein